jgi:CubicO group peptidase (beta-lactamase class C family)
MAVMKDGEILYKQGYGMAHLELDVPLLPSTVLNIGSMAKQFTAFAVALLEAEGRISLDDDIHKYLPEMHDFGPTITIRHLIHHTSGIRCTFPDLLGLAGWYESDVTTTNDTFRLLKAQRELDFLPGEEYTYSNSNYILLAIMCERVSGQSFADFCQERIFGPLGMTRSVVNDSVFRLIPGRACGYFGDDQGVWYNAPLTDSVVGPTNVYTTVEDLARWDENFYTCQIGGEAVTKQMHQPGKLNDGTELSYAFGLELGQHRGWRMVEHGGGQGGYCSWMVRFPELRLSVVVLFNYFLWGARGYALKVADLFLEDRPSQQTEAEAPSPPRETVVPIELSPEQLEGKVGTYFNSARAAVREITLVEGRLQYLGLDLVPVAENRFFFEEEPHIYVEFTPAMAETATGVKTITPSGEYGYERVETTTPTAEALRQYAGRYYSPELDVYWTLFAGDDHLVAGRHKYADSKLSPLFEDAFRDDWTPIVGFPRSYLVVFERDEHNAIIGLRVSGDRVRNLRFDRKWGDSKVVQ